MQQQWGDDPTPVMSFIGSRDEHPEQICCYVTRTTEETHDISAVVLTAAHVRW